MSNYVMLKLIILTVLWNFSHNIKTLLHSFLYSISTSLYNCLGNPGYLYSVHLFWSVIPYYEIFCFPSPHIQMLYA